MANGPYRPGNGLNSFVTTMPPTVQAGPAIAGSGSPEGVVPANPGTAYTDNDNNDLWVKFAGVGNLGWKLVGKTPASSTTGGGVGQQVFSGTATNPNNVVTALAPAYYYSTVDQSQWVKTNTGSNNTGWVAFVGGS